MCLVSILTRHKLLGNKSMLATGHYSSPVGGVGEEGVWGHLIFGRTKGGISSNWEPKRGDR